MRLSRRRALLNFALLAGVALAGCSYDDASGPGDGNIGRVEVAPTVDTIVAGATFEPEDTLRVSATVFSNTGVALQNASVAWSSSDDTVAVVDSTGLVRATGYGTTRITASSGGREAVAVITVVREAGVTDIDSVFTQVTAGQDFTCATSSLGRAYCWGFDHVQQLGAVATDTVCLDAIGAVEVDDSTSTISSYPCSLLPVRVQSPRTLTGVAAGAVHACAVADNGEAFCWGNGALGRLGNGDVSVIDVPELVTSALAFASTAPADDHTCALTTDGAAYCWGADGFGQLGNLVRASSTTPIPVDGGIAFQAIASGRRYSCGLSTDGAAYCWGSNAEGQLGLGGVAGTPINSDTPVPVTGGLAFSQISLGGATACGVATTGTLYCWGAGGEGQLGTGATTASNATPQAVPGGPWRSVAVGETHACALSEPAGELYCWGRYDLGPLRSSANNQDFISLTPVRIGDVAFTGITSGRRHSCGVTATGAAYCWGSNVLGPLGDGLQALLRLTPQRVKTPL